MPKMLHQYLDDSVARVPDRIAVEDPTGTKIDYSELGQLSDRLRDRLISMGVRPGDRVAFCLHKSVDSVITIFGVLKTGAAYVPLDPTAPVARNAFIVTNCSVSALIVDGRFVDGFNRALDDGLSGVPLLVLDESVERPRIRAALAAEPAAPRTSTHDPEPGDLAYVLYTSGSTGRPKGVMLTHENATAFVDWCSEVFEPSEGDRLSSHAPLHFDLSILDVYLAIKHGAALVLIGEEVGKTPDKLAGLIAERRISIWYSTPSILSLMAEFGKMEQHDYSSLRLVLFAGEVFPVKHLRAFKQLVPGPRYWNLYGPTETNVCTYYEIPATIPDDRTVPYPIGKPCSHYTAKVIDEKGNEVPRGEEGELIMHGSAVTPGYWALPDKTAAAYYKDAGGRLWYRTGDIVIEGADGNYTYLGRRDRMIKKRGYRVELGEIETCLYRHASIEEAGVVARPDGDENLQVLAFVSPRGDEKLSIVSLKQFCAERLPGYMIPDCFVQLERLPRTSTNKVDYQSLTKMPV